LCQYTAPGYDLGAYGLPRGGNARLHATIRGKRTDEWKWRRHEQGKGESQTGIIFPLILSAAALAASSRTAP